eukprot:5749455-Alexandrium_andersonii.AAC.1
MRCCSCAFLSAVPQRAHGLTLAGVQGQRSQTRTAHRHAEARQWQSPQLRLPDGGTLAGVARLNHGVQVAGLRRP